MDPFKNYEFRKPLPGYTVGGTNIDYFDTRSAIEAISQGAYAKLPYTSRVLAEQLVRKCAPDILTDCFFCHCQYDSPSH